MHHPGSHMLTLKQKQKFNFTIMSPQLPPNDDPVPRLSSHPALVMGALHSGQDEGTSATQVTKYRVMTEKEVYVERFCDTLMHGQFLLCSKAYITFCAKKKPRMSLIGFIYSQPWLPPVGEMSNQ